MLFSLSYLVLFHHGLARAPSTILIFQDLKDYGRQGAESVSFADIDRYSGNG